MFYMRPPFSEEYSRERSFVDERRRLEASLDELGDSHVGGLDPYPDEPAETKPRAQKAKEVAAEMKTLKDKIAAKERELTSMHIKTAQVKAELDILTAQYRGLELVQ